MSKQWYSTISAYKYNDKFNISEEEFLEKLKEHKIEPCGKSSLKTIGWDPLLIDDDSTLCIKASGAYLLKLKIEEKLIPSAIVKEETEKEVSKREKQSGNKLSKSDKNDIKEGIIAKMKAQAFVKSSYIYGYLDVKNEKLVVNGSASKADIFTNYLRNTLGSLDVEILEPDFELNTVLTDVLLDPSKFKKFDIGYECKLKDFLDGRATITAKDQDLFSDEIKDHVTSGKQVESLALVWEKRISFKLNHEFKITGIKPLDIIKEQADESGGESTDAYSKIVSNMFIMVEDFNELIDDLLKIA
jgi:recombination associated protein RdgC